MSLRGTNNMFANSIFENYEDYIGYLRDALSAHISVGEAKSIIEETEEMENNVRKHQLATTRLSQEYFVVLYTINSTEPKVIEAKKNIDTEKHPSHKEAKRRGDIKIVLTALMERNSKLKTHEPQKSKAGAWAAVASSTTADGSTNHGPSSTRTSDISEDLLDSSERV
ncbi:hypothetical protein BDV96DRAFT_641679 [Lophiotrema nucula]|uniref:Uncharacterized protein n=1 Tax=Lophiotrema nucula TaxID=690887 RepID=A0A6A5ZQB9_9PLEO|nr:hypothetical protein BDV96DRAFT_641679 [Lophiotrema nucula]